jgi:integrase
MKISEVTKSGRRGARKRWRLIFWCPETRRNVRRLFATEKEAQHFFTTYQRTRARGIPAPILQASVGTLADVVLALELAQQDGFSLLDAARAFSKKTKQAAGLLTMPTDLESEFISFKEKEGCRAATLQAYRSAFGSIRLRLKDRPMQQLSGDEARALFERMAEGVSAVSVNNWRRHAHSFFEWLVEKGHRPDNPCAGVPIRRVTRTEPCIYSVDEAERLLRAVENSAPQFARAFVLALFTGIRPKGIDRLTDADILLDEKLVRVGWEQDKTGQKYFAPLPANALAWLSRYRADQRLGVPRNARTKLLAEAGVKHGHDILRHTFASHHLAAHGSADSTASALNHRSTDMLFRHYRAAVKPADGARFFKILPSAKRA